MVQVLTQPELATFNSNLCTSYSGFEDCVPQPGTTSRLEALSSFPMGPLQYRNFGDHETLLFNHTVNADGNGLAGIRWYELRRTPPGVGPPGFGLWKIFQQGTFNPTFNIHYWMASIAMDQAGNIALGYSVSSPTVFPGIRIAGRAHNTLDPLGQMTTPEVRLTGPLGSSKTCIDTKQNPPAVVGCRWGDYSAMRVDPADGCTFWYTTEYRNSTTVRPHAGQQIHVGAVRFPFPTCIPNPPRKPPSD